MLKGDLLWMSEGWDTGVDYGTATPPSAGLGGFLIGDTEVSTRIRESCLGDDWR